MGKASQRIIDEEDAYRPPPYNACLAANNNSAMTLSYLNTHHQQDSTSTGMIIAQPPSSATPHLSNGQYSAQLNEGGNDGKTVIIIAAPENGSVCDSSSDSFSNNSNSSVNANQENRQNKGEEEDKKSSLFYRLLPFFLALGYVILLLIMHSRCSFVANLILPSAFAVLVYSLRLPCSLCSKSRLKVFLDTVCVVINCCHFLISLYLSVNNYKEQDMDCFKLSSLSLVLSFGLVIFFAPTGCWFFF